MNQLWVLLQQKYSYSFRQEYNRDDRCRQVSHAMWAAEFQRRGFFWDEVQAAAETADTSAMPIVSLAAFVGLVRDMRGDNHPESRMGHASRRPASEVLAEWEGTSRAAELPYLGEDAKARSNRVGNEHLKMLFDNW